MDISNSVHVWIVCESILLQTLMKSSENAKCQQKNQLLDVIVEWDLQKEVQWITLHVDRRGVEKVDCPNWTVLFINHKNRKAHSQTG